MDCLRQTGQIVSQSVRSAWRKVKTASRLPGIAARSLLKERAKESRLSYIIGQCITVVVLALAILGVVFAWYSNMFTREGNKRTEQSNKLSTKQICLSQGLGDEDQAYCDVHATDLLLENIWSSVGWVNHKLVQLRTRLAAVGGSWCLSDIWHDQGNLCLGAAVILFWLCYRSFSLVGRGDLTRKTSWLDGYTITPLSFGFEAVSGAFIWTRLCLKIIRNTYWDGICLGRAWVVIPFVWLLIHLRMKPAWASLPLEDWPVQSGDIYKILRTSDFICIGISMAFAGLYHAYAIRLIGHRALASKFCQVLDAAVMGVWCFFL
jgi:hypothetical protein